MFQNADDQKWQRVPRLTPLCVESLGIPSDVSHTLLDMCLNKTYIVSDGFNFKSINKLSLFFFPFSSVLFFILPGRHKSHIESS